MTTATLQIVYEKVSFGEVPNKDQAQQSQPNTLWSHGVRVQKDFSPAEAIDLGMPCLLTRPATAGELEAQSQAIPSKGKGKGKRKNNYNDYKLLQDMLHKKGFFDEKATGPKEEIEPTKPAQKRVLDRADKTLLQRAAHLIK